LIVIVSPLDPAQIWTRDPGYPCAALSAAATVRKGPQSGVTLSVKSTRRVGVPRMANVASKP